MKKNHIVSIAMLSLMLVGCQGGVTSEPLDGGSVAKGKAISREECRQKLENSIEAMADDDAIGLSLENVFSHYQMTMTKQVPGGKHHAGKEIQMECHSNIDDVVFNVGLRGLTASELDQLNGSLEVAASFDIGGKVTIDGQEKEHQSPKGSYGFNGYLAGDHCYLDFSNTKFQEMIDGKREHDDDFEEFCKGQRPENHVAPEKVSFKNGITADMLPIMSKENLDLLVSSISTKIEDVASKGGTVQALDHGDGSYSYSVELESLEDGEEFLEEFEFDDLVELEDMVDLEDDIEDALSGHHKEGHLRGDLAVNAYNIAFVFDAEGISSIGISLDLSYLYEKTFTYGNQTHSTSVEMNYTLNGKLNFLLDSEVEVKAVENPEAYQEIVLTEEDKEELLDIID